MNTQPEPLTQQPPQTSQESKAASPQPAPAQYGHHAPSAEALPLQTLQPREALEQFLQNPVAFIQHVVNDAAQTHLSNMKEEAELRGAVHALSKTYPEFDRFQPFIMQEAALLIQNDPDGVIEPWHQLLEKAVNNFKLKFEKTIQQTTPETNREPVGIPLMEAGSNRTLPEVPPTFTREQIAKMSLPEFLKMENAINSALQNKRIQ